jgi:hypothetical protein
LPPSDLFGGFDVATNAGLGPGTVQGMGPNMVPSAYDAYPGFKELTGVVNGTGAPNAGTPDGGVKSFADVFTTPGDLAGPTGGFVPGDSKSASAGTRSRCRTPWTT